MSAPAEPRAGQPTGGDKGPRRGQRHRPPHQHYKRTSAIIDDRPDGKPILFNYGRHMTKLEKEHAKVMIAYSVLAAVVAACLAIFVVFAVFNLYISPNQTVATINGSRINRNDRDLMTKYYAYYAAQQASQGTTTSSDPQALAVSALQRQTLTAVEAKSLLGIVTTSADVDAEFKKIEGTASSSSVSSFLSQIGISQDDYLRLFIAPQALEQKVGAYLARNNPKTAEEWHFARIAVANKKTATQLLDQIARNANNKGGTQASLFAKLAKSKSTDTASKSQGGDLGWERASDTATDSLLGPKLVTVLRSMEQTNTAFRLYNVGSAWYVINFLGHDLKHKLTDAQTQSDVTNAFNAWYQPLLAKAVANPSLVSNSVTSAPVATAMPTQASALFPTAMPTAAKPAATGKKK